MYLNTHHTTLGYEETCTRAGQDVLYTRRIKDHAQSNELTRGPPELDQRQRAGREINFFPVVEVGTAPLPHPQESVPSPPLIPGGGGEDSPAEEGVGESQF